LGKSAFVVFAVALLLSGISSTTTSAMAGGSIFAGIYKEPFDIKDNHSRLGVVISLLVAFLIIIFIRDPFKGLVISQMILSIQLPITVFTQVYLTSSKKVMGAYVNKKVTTFLLLLIAAVLTFLNGLLFVSFFS
jgi:manganese transport protein